MVEIKLIKMTNITPNLQILLNRETRKKAQTGHCTFETNQGLN